jgi:hypothetical protein
VQQLAVSLISSGGWQAMFFKNKSAANKALQRIGNSWHLFGIASLAKKPPTVTNRRAQR